MYGSTYTGERRLAAALPTTTNKTSSIMNVTELSREQIVELKGDYLCRLADEGTFAEVMGVDYDAPSWGDMANADEIVPDDVIFEEYAGTDFVPDDFCCSCS